MVSAWVWQLQNDYPGANPDDSALPIDEMWIKAADGMWPQGTFDQHPAEISGLPAARALRDIYDRQSINMIPWVVPHGRYPGAGPGPRDASYAFEEGKMHGQYAAAAKSIGNDRAILIVDLEPSYYGGDGNPQYWRDDLGAGPQEVAEYLRGCAMGGAVEVWLSSVWRTNPEALRDVSIGSWLNNPLVAEVHPQVYWTDFDKPWDVALAEFDRAVLTLAPRRMGIEGGLGIRPTMPGDSGAAAIRDFIAECERRGYRRPSIWRRGIVSPPNWGAIRGSTRYLITPTPPPAPAPDAAIDVPGALAALGVATAAIDAARAELGG